ncbi:MAG: efflux RND transporter periplasmic adaptor subunit [bacterium]|nr:efflux RND transporter periplasmic adaptor subunit [bacterium]
MKFKTVTILILTLLLMTSGMFADAAKPVKCPGTVSVLVHKVATSTFNEFKGLTKRVLPAKDDELKAGVAGVIKKIEKAVGSTVKKGDVIVVLESETLEKEIREITANSKLWKKKLRQRKGWKVKSEKAEKQAESKLFDFQEQLKAAQQKLANTKLVAPSDGTVGSLNANEGDHVSDGYAIGNVVDTRQVKLALNTYAANVKQGQEVEIFIKEINKKVKGTVKQNNGNTDIFINNSAGNILVGMTANFNVLLKIHPNAIAIHKNFLMKDGSTFVYTVNGKRAKKSIVTTGPISPKGYVLITEGLEAGDELIINEILSAKEGTLKKAITCLQDNKKIKPMAKDSETGKFIKRKTGKKTKKKKAKTEKTPKPVKKKKAKKVKSETGTSPLSKFKFGVTAAWYKINDDNFDSFYGKPRLFGIDVSYMIMDNLDIWINYNMGSSSKSVDWSDTDLEFKLKPFTIDLRYYLVKKPKFDLLAGAGVSLISFEDINPHENVSESVTGFNVVAGGYFHVTRNISVQLLLQANMAKEKTISAQVEEPVNTIKLSSMELLFGISFNL